MAPLAARSEQVRHVQDNQVRHPGVPAVASVGQVSWPRYSLSAQPLRLDECPGVGDPIDVLAHLLESLCAGSGELPRFVLNTSTDWQPLFAGDLDLLLVPLAHGSGLPLADATPHDLWAVGFANIFAVDEDVEHAHIPPVVIQVKLTALQS